MFFCCCTFLVPEPIILTLHTYLSPFSLLVHLNWSGLSLSQQHSENNISMSTLSVEERTINEQQYLTFNWHLWDVFRYNSLQLLSFLKVPISSKFLFSHPILHFMHWTSEHLDLGKKRFFYECLKTWKSYFLAVDPCRWSQHRHAQSCDVDSGTCDFRLDLSRLFYLCKFSFVVHAKCSFPACCMNY